MNTDAKMFLIMNTIKTCVHAASLKHPFFAAKLVEDDTTLESIRERLEAARMIEDQREDNSCQSLESILNEEILEAYEAAKLGDLDACFNELAQCAAVIVRGMSLVIDKMMEK